MLRDRGEALEADFQRFYNLDLADLWRGKISIRKASVLTLHLPPESAVFRVGPDDQIWSRETQAITDLRNELRHIVKENASPLPRPGDQFRQQQVVDAAFRKAERWKRRRAG